VPKIIELLNSAKDERLIGELNREELKEVKRLANLLGSDAEARLAELSAAENSDPDYIDVVIVGKRDRIKKDIEVLNISCNEFDKLPEAIYELTNLKKLYLFNNRFSEEEKNRIRQRLSPGVHIYF